MTLFEKVHPNLLSYDLTTFFNNQFLLSLNTHFKTTKLPKKASEFIDQIKRSMNRFNRRSFIDVESIKTR